MQPKSDAGGNLFIRRRGRRRAAWFLAAVLTVLGTLIAITSCGHRTADSTGPATAEPLILRVACPGEPAATVVSRYGQGWVNAEHGLKVVRYHPGKGPDEQMGADAWIIAPAEMPHWAAAGVLQPVPEVYHAPDNPYEWNKLLSVYRNKLLLWDNTPYAMPLLGDAYLCFYRKDLVEDAEQRQAFQERFHRELAAPTTWEEFADLAEFFAQGKRPGKSQPQPSLPPLPTWDEDLDHEFYAVAVPFARHAYREAEAQPRDLGEVLSFHYDLKTMAVRIDTAGFVHALQLLKRLQACRLPGTLAEPASAFEKGEAVLCLASPSWIRRYQNSSQTGGKFGICRLPGSRTVANFATGKLLPQAQINFVPYLGAEGWVGVVPRSSKHPDEAFALLASLSDLKTSRNIVIEPDWGGGVFRREHLDAQMGWHSFRLGPEQTRVLVECLRQTEGVQVKNPVVRLRIPDQQSHLQALVTEVRAALTQGKDAQQALTAAARRWRELDSAKSPQQRRTDYRLSLSIGRSD
jgi:multiple sugar transport system substrate-binding protein